MDRRTFFFSALSGILIFLSFPKFGTGWFVWIALVPLFISLEGKSARSSLPVGFIAGLIFNIGLFYWISIVVVKYGYLPVYLGVTAMLLVCSALAAYIALFSAGFSYLRQKGFPVIVVAPSLWVAMEYAKAYLFSGFPWESLGYSQYSFLHLIQAADMTGIYGISFLIVLVNAAIYGIVSRRDRKRSILECTACLMLIVGVVLYGYFRLDTVREAMTAAETKQVALVQANVDQSVKWNPQYERETLDIFLNLTRGEDHNQGLIVWPETSTPFFFQNSDDRQREILSCAKRSGSYLLLGSPSYRKENGRELFMNSAFLVSPSGEILGKYDKIHLVPFGEYIPFRKIFPFIGQLVIGMGDFEPGGTFNSLPLGIEKIGVLICYESIFPDISRAFKNSGTTLLVNITNDAWFDQSSAPYQHLSMVTFRAIENRLYIARSANTGISAIIDPTGRITAKTGLFTREVLKGKVGFIRETTVYNRIGDLFAYICIAFAASCFALSLRRRGTIP